MKKIITYVVILLLVGCAHHQLNHPFPSDLNGKFESESVKIEFREMFNSCRAKSPGQTELHGIGLGSIYSDHVLHLPSTDSSYLPPEKDYPDCITIVNTNENWQIFVLHPDSIFTNAPTRLNKFTEYVYWERLENK